MVTSTSTPASMLMMICLTVSVGARRLEATVSKPHPPRKTTYGETHSIRRLWTRISYLSQVLEPSPQGDLRVTTCRVLVGRRTGPLTCRDLERARSISSWHTFSREATLREVSVIRILWTFYNSRV
jgi:hypothetical protein